MSKSFVPFIVGLLPLVGAGISGCDSTSGPDSQAASARPEGACRRIELLRDAWGVPHVFADTDAGAMYGLGYATAQDRAFQMYYNLRIIQGRLAELVGDVKVGVTRQQPEGRNSALRNDIAMRTIGYWQAAQETANKLDPEARSLLEAYSQGINDCLTTDPNGRGHLFEKYGLEPESWTPAACIASWWRLGLFFSGDGLRELIPYYEIEDGARTVRRFAATDSAGATEGLRIRDEASVIQRSDVSDAWLQEVMAYATEHNLVRKVDVPAAESRPGPRFSHAWVVGGKRTTTGSAVLVSDPQTPVRNPSLFYEHHITGKTFNARGIGVAGCPSFLIGFTPNVAWGLTALGADQADLFLLKTDPNHPNQYLLDGSWRDMEVRTETIQVKNGTPRTLTFRGTRFGPVVTAIAMGVRRGDEVALKRIPICEPDRDTFRAVLDMVRSRDIYEFQRALGGWSFPSANCVFGDRKGNIGFKTILSLPVRSAHSLLDDRAAHEGWDSDNDWQGIVPHELLPQVINPEQGWLVSANHRPIASFYPLSLGISTGSGGDTDRSWRLKERMWAMTSGSEKGKSGLYSSTKSQSWPDLPSSEPSFTPEDVLDIHYDTVAPIKRDLIRLGYHLRDVQKYPLDEDTLLALDYLEDWRAAGCKSDMSIQGTEIVNLMPMAFRQNFAAAVTYGGGLSGLCTMLQTIDQRIAADPNAALTGEEADYVNLIVRAAWRYGKARFGDDATRWHERGQQALLETTLPYMSTLDGFGSLDEDRDITMPALRCTDGGTILSQQAQSYTQYVRLDDADKSMSILPIGQSEHPESPYRLSTCDLWGQGKLHPAPLSRRAVQDIAASRTILKP
ncbi:MAG TPA: penicillin acylase family protein [Sedimentisphaerales bacterium]|jgi:acyl-homoserine lactone acylase PvdQ|nr:penicillin acylase family protein [Sedimentisphaerales bacterium]HNU30770.1 penicillin acylase family protein [Sedimentisphaerales bacterium]